MMMKQPVSSASGFYALDFLEFQAAQAVVRVWLSTTLAWRSKHEGKYGAVITIRNNQKGLWKSPSNGSRTSIPAYISKPFSSVWQPVSATLQSHESYTSDPDAYSQANSYRIPACRLNKKCQTQELTLMHRIRCALSSLR